MMYQLLHLGVNDPDDEYRSIDSTFWKLMIQQFKEASGVHVAPTIDDEMDKKLAGYPFEQGIVYFMICIMWI